MTPPAYPFPCPRCGARAFEQCRTLSTGRKTDTHAARISARSARTDERERIAGDSHTAYVGPAGVDV